MLQIFSGDIIERRGRERVGFRLASACSIAQRFPFPKNSTNAGVSEESRMQRSSRAIGFSA